MKPRDTQIAGLYDLGKTIGTGHFAAVKSARHVFTGEEVAVKIIDKTKLDEAARSHLYQEVRCMQLVQHPHVVKLFDVIDTNTKLYLILELGTGGDLYDFLTCSTDRGLTEEFARIYFSQIVSAIAYCHKLHVVHRDLKPENVILFPTEGGTAHVKLTDFGFSNKFTPGDKLATSCGSLAYSAPEILLGDSYDAPAVDIWSLGVILFMLVSGRLPFKEANDSETLTRIMDCNYKLADSLSLSLKTLIRSMLVRDPKKRITIDELLIDSWVTGLCGNELITPLVIRSEISQAERQLIIERMIEGKIGTREEIEAALHDSDDEYNRVTATFYLLAERLLKQQACESGDCNGTGKQVREPALQKPQFSTEYHPFHSLTSVISTIREEDGAEEEDVDLTTRQIPPQTLQNIMEQSESDDDVSLPGSRRKMSLNSMGGSVRQRDRSNTLERRVELELEISDDDKRSSRNSSLRRKALPVRDSQTTSSLSLRPRRRDPLAQRWSDFGISNVHSRASSEFSISSTLSARIFAQKTPSTTSVCSNRSLPITLQSIVSMVKLRLEEKRASLQAEVSLGTDEVDVAVRELSVSPPLPARSNRGCGRFLLSLMCCASGQANR